MLKGPAYLFLSPEDATSLADCVKTRKLELAGGEVRHVITDIIGRKHGLGVENLRGSGTIAGETSGAYEDIFTLTFITGRTVGIGSYLARLGQRIIQKESPPQAMICMMMMRIMIMISTMMMLFVVE